MAQGVLPYKYEQENQTSGMTSLAGLPIYLDLASVLNLGESIARHLHIKVQGWTDEQIVMSLILLNLAGGDSADDLRVLEADEGFCKVLQRIELRGLKRKERRDRERRGLKREASVRSFPFCRLSATLPPFMKTAHALKERRLSLLCPIFCRRLHRSTPTLLLPSMHESR